MDEPQDCVQFHAAKASRSFEGHGLKPNFRHHVLTSHVNVRWFAPIQGHKEETIRTTSQNRWYCSFILYPVIRSGREKPLPARRDSPARQPGATD
jgi:hypothetical protein